MGVYLFIQIGNKYFSLRTNEWNIFCMLPEKTLINQFQNMLKQRNGNNVKKKYIKLIKTLIHEPRSTYEVLGNLLLTKTKLKRSNYLFRSAFFASPLPQSVCSVKSDSL